MPNNRIYWLHALTPTHAGVGRGIGYIDLPVDRDGVTNWSLIRGSAFKGVWADYYKATDDNRRKDSPEGRKLCAAFGISSNGADTPSNSGSLIPTDARLVCLPVRSFRGTFAWCTSALALRMLHRTLTLAGLAAPAVPESPPESNTTTNARGVAFHAQDTVLAERGAVYLEDLDFTAKANEATHAWASAIAGWVFPDTKDPWRKEFQKRFAVLPDVVFDFLTETGTEVNTRVKISDDTKTVIDGALWTEESLPAETILAGVIACDRVFGRDGKEITTSGLLDTFATTSLNLQIGGKATVGRGQVRCVFTSPETGGAK